MRAPNTLLIVLALSVAVDALTREQAKENKMCRKVKKRKTKYVAAKEKYEEKYEKSCEEDDEEEVGVKATCAECASVACDKWAASPSTSAGLRYLISATGMPKEQAGCCVDTSELTDFSYLGFFLDVFGTNDPICWDTAKVTTFENMLNGATKFNGALVGWDTSKVTKMDRTFSSAEVFNRPLNWDTSKVTTMDYTFCSQYLSLIHI